MEAKMTDEQRRARIVYDGQKYTVPAVEAEKVSSAMTSTTPVRVDLEVSGEVLTLVVGAGIPVVVIEGRRTARERSGVIL